MLQRTNKILIGKDIDRTAAVVGGANYTTLIAPTTGIANGEIVVLDKNKEVLSAGATVSDTDLIYIVQGSSRTFDYTNAQGTVVTAARELISSDPIEGNKVKNFEARTFVPKAEQTAYVDLTGWTPAIGTEYIIRIVYKDIKEHPGQFTQTYRHVATTTTLDTEGTALAAKVNAHKGRRVDATYTTGTDVLLLTAREIPSCCTSTSDIDEFDMVEFDVYFNYVHATTGVWTTIASTSTTVTVSGPTKGSGNWEQIRDLEKAQLGYVGISNKTHFPVVSKTLDTVVDSEYNMIVIEHDKSYLSPDNQYVKQAPLTTIIAIEVGALQTADVLGQLNPWMASAGFNAVSF